MAKLNLYSNDGKISGGVEASDAVFMAPENEYVVNETMNWYLASQRQGNACAKTRAEVSGGGKKPWRQKGTGRARAGDNRPPHWRKGGVAHPPRPRDYSFSLPIKVRKAAIRTVLSSKAREDKIKVVDKFALADAKTKEMVKFLKALGAKGSVLIVLPEEDIIVDRASRNIKGIKVSSGKTLNVYDLLKYDEVVMTKDTIKAIEEAFV